MCLHPSPTSAQQEAFWGNDALALEMAPSVERRQRPCCSFVRFAVHRNFLLARAVVAAVRTWRGRVCHGGHPEGWAPNIPRVCISVKMCSRLAWGVMVGARGGTNLAATSCTRLSSLGRGAWAAGHAGAQLQLAPPPPLYTPAGHRITRGHECNCCLVPTTAEAICNGIGSRAGQEMRRVAGCPALVTCPVPQSQDCTSWSRDRRGPCAHCVRSCDCHMRVPGARKEASQWSRLGHCAEAGDGRDVYSAAP